MKERYRRSQYPIPLQLACIVNMVPRWKRLQIRAFILVRSDNPNPDLLQRQRDLVAKMLELLRIRSAHSVTDLPGRCTNVV